MLYSSYKENDISLIMGGLQKQNTRRMSNCKSI